MDEQSMGDALRRYIVTEILEGDEEGLDGQTPLLEWGILNSMEMVRLLAFLGERFEVTIPLQEVGPANFRSIDSIVALVKSHALEREADVGRRF
jgi:acyl carrier protein